MHLGQLRIGLALLLGMAIGPAPATETLTVDRWQALQARAPIVTPAKAAEMAAQWLVRTDADAVLRELTLDRAARALGELAPSPTRKQLLQRIAAEPVTTMAALEDAGRTIPVPAFSAAATARAALQAWEQRALVQATESAVAARDADALHRMAGQQTGPFANALVEVLGRLSASQRREAVRWLRTTAAANQPASLLAMANVERTAAAYTAWLDAVDDHQPVAASDVAAGLVATRQNLTPEAALDVHRLALQQASTAALAARALAALAVEHAEVMNAVLAHLDAALGQAGHGNDVAVALASLGEPGVAVLRAAAQADDRQTAAAALNGLRVAGEQDALGAYLQDSTRPPDMQRQVQAWLAP